MAPKYIALFGFLAIAYTTEARTVIPFQLIGKLIVIKVVINEQPGNYILDTGTSGLVLNSEFHHQTGTGKRGELIDSKGKSIKYDEAIVDLQIGEEYWKNIKSAILPLHHLSRLKDIPIMGLIGTFVFLHYQLILDFEQQEITLIKVAGQKQEAPYSSDQAADVVLPFRWKTGIPVLKLSVASKTLDFALDSGAEVNILAANRTKGLRDQLTLGKPITVFAVQTGSYSAETARLRNVIIDQFICPNLDLVIMNIQKFNLLTAGQRVDGIFGTNFILHFKTAINFKKQVIELWYKPSAEKTILNGRFEMRRN